MGANLPAVDLDGDAVAVVAAAYTSCALRADYRVKCWGFNGSGQLGIGDYISRGFNPAEMGANLPAADLGGDVVSVNAGSFHLCAVLSDDRVKCWGYNNRG